MTSSIVHLCEILQTSPEAAYNAWVHPSMMTRWLFKSPTNRLEVPMQELHPGGRYSILETTVKGEKIDHFGSYLTIVPAQRLSFTLEVPSHFPGITTVVVTFSPAESGCSMDFRQSGVEPRIIEDSWKAMFAQLKAIWL